MLTKRAFSLLIIALLVAPTTNAQRLVCSIGPGGAGSNPAYDQPPTQAALAELDYILDLLCPQGCGSVTLVSNQTTGGAMSELMGPGYSKISYNPAFMNGVWSQFGPGASFGIMAHELGHHLDFNINAPWMDHSWGRELRADAWAGCALARAGLPEAQMDAALQAVAAYPSPTHPGWQQRAYAVREGYSWCSH